MSMIQYKLTTYVVNLSTKEGGGQKSSKFSQHNLWMALNFFERGLGFFWTSLWGGVNCQKENYVTGNTSVKYNKWNKIGLNQLNKK